MARLFALFPPRAVFILTALCAGASGVHAQRILSIDVNTGQAGNYTAAFQTAVSAGLTEIGLTFPWNSIEVAPGVYQNSNLATANAFYPAYGVPVRLMISPVASNVLVVPSDLTGDSFDNPTLIARFNSMLDWVATQVPNLTVSVITLGNEYDLYLGTNTTEWAAYTTFYAATAAHAHTLWPHALVSAEATLAGATGPMLSYNQTLNQPSSVVSVSYYPLNSNYTVQSPQVVQTAFQQICALYTQPIDFEEIGYPSGTLDMSSTSLQAQFVDDVFAAWDQYATRVRMVDFTWMNDLSPLAALQTANFYGIHDPRFTGYLGSLGLIQYHGTAKPAWQHLVTDSAARGF